MIIIIKKCINIIEIALLKKENFVILFQLLISMKGLSNYKTHFNSYLNVKRPECFIN